MLRIAILAVVLAGCPAKTEPMNPPTTTRPPVTEPPAGSATPPSSGSSAEPAGSATPPQVTPTKPPPADAVACETNADCKSHACGPCGSGDVLTKHDVSINCLRNPCPRTTVSCKNKVCTVD